jgi:S1-C subfamily serine protease
MCKKLMWVGCVVVLVFGVWLNLPTDVTKLSNSVVMLTDDMGHGSGAIVGPDCVLTAKHVSVHMPMVVKTADGETFNIVKVVEDPDSDLSLVYIDGVFDETPLKLDPTPLKVGDKITLIGCPGEVGLPACVLPGFVVRVDYDFIFGFTELNELGLDMIDAHGEPGVSGGPVIDTNGHVRSVLVIGDGILCGAVPVSELNVE